jgi:predicted Fe-Mo cluster-binding NifX family protein
MRVVITSEGQTLEDPVDPRFGRCSYFLIVETEGRRVEAVPNEASRLGGGAGIQAAETVAGFKPDVLITGRLGPNAERALQAAGLQVCLGASGTTGEALDAYLEGRLKPGQPQGPGASGRGMGQGRGMGMGRGRGMGGGGGLGGGRGGGRGF